jgi:ectoine hydroxylase-related dioxygenase (phytanoyl-CoA dioxygenase family)
MSADVEIWISKREQLSRDGVCIIENVLDREMLERVRDYVRTIVKNLSEEHRREQRSTGSMVPNRELPELADLLAWPRTIEACERLGFRDVKLARAYVISKPPHSPRLFWHQDCTMWHGEPRTYSDTTPQLFAMFYLTDTSRENGCLRVIPGSHRKRHRLHDLVSVAHTPESRRAEHQDAPLYADVEDEMDIPAKAGDLVLGDGRTLHASHSNQSDKERTVITIWYHPMFSDLQEATQRQISDLAQAEVTHWPESARRIVTPIIADYSGSAAPLPRDRVPGPELK